MHPNDVIIPTQYGGIALFAQKDTEGVTFSKQLAKPSPEEEPILSFSMDEVIEFLTGDKTWPATLDGVGGSVTLNYDKTVVYIGTSRLEVTTEDFINKMHYLLGLDQV